MTKILISIGLLVILSGCAGEKTNRSADILTNSGNGIVSSERFQLMWQQDRSKLLHSAAEAQEYVDTLRLGGYADWRIPTKAESHNLFFSLDFGESKAKELDMKMNGSIWVIMEDGTIQAGTWDAGETCCITRTFLREAKGRVRAVRP